MSMNHGVASGFDWLGGRRHEGKLDASSAALPPARSRSARWKALTGTPRHFIGSLRHGGVAVLMLVAIFALCGCASTPDAVVEDDMEAFTQGIDGILKIGMSYKEARQALRARMPRASLETEGPVPGTNRATRMRRFMIGWPTLNRGTTLIVTIFVDRERKVVRWTTGPLTENR